MNCFNKELNIFIQRYNAEILRSDNYFRRKGFVTYSTYGVLMMTFLLNKRGYLRYSMRSALIYYILASSILCPENLNPFNMPFTK
jgi:hypothetical protein